MHVVKALTADLQREGRRENAIDVLGPRLCAVGRQSSDVRRLHRLKLLNPDKGPVRISEKM